MYGMKSTKSSNVPSDDQAREKLAMYVYEYLLHVGAPKTASVFLQEIGWNKNIAVGESPGFLHGWWCVFWDLYCASPERRETNEHSSEAKAFHDYSAAVSSPCILPQDGLGQSNMLPGYFPPGSAPSPSPHHNPNNPMLRQPFMSPRYPHSGPRPGMQGPGPQPMFQGPEHHRQGQMMCMARMAPGRGVPPGHMNPYGSEQFQQPYGGVRMPASSIPGHSGIGMPNMHGRSPWANPSGPGGPSAGGPPTTPIMRSPQGPRPPMHPGPHPHRFPAPHDPKNPDPMNAEYGHMGKSMTHQQMASSFPMSSVPDNMPPASLPTGPGLPASTPNMTPGLNGMNGAVPEQAMMDGLPKSSPNNMPMNAIGSGPMGPPGGPGGTPHAPQDGEGEYLSQFGDNTESAAILKIKESMPHGMVKLFENKDGEGAGVADFNFLS